METSLRSAENHDIPIRFSAVDLMSHGGQLGRALFLWRTYRHSKSWSKKNWNAGTLGRRRSDRRRAGPHD